MCIQSWNPTESHLKLQENVTECKFTISEWDTNLGEGKPKPFNLLCTWWIRHYTKTWEPAETFESWRAHWSSLFPSPWICFASVLHKVFIWTYAYISQHKPKGSSISFLRGGERVLDQTYWYQNKKLEPYLVFFPYIQWSTMYFQLNNLFWVKRKHWKGSNVSMI